jgi:hypothetical protein
MTIAVMTTEMLSKHNTRDIRAAARDVAKVLSGGLQPIYFVMKKRKLPQSRLNSGR